MHPFWHFFSNCEFHRVRTLKGQLKPLSHWVDWESMVIIKCIAWSRLLTVKLIHQWQCWWSRWVYDATRSIIMLCLTSCLFSDFTTNHFGVIGDNDDGRDVPHVHMIFSGQCLASWVWGTKIWKSWNIRKPEFWRVRTQPLYGCLYQFFTVRRSYIMICPTIPQTFQGKFWWSPHCEMHLYHI